MTNRVTVEDIEARWRPLSDQEQVNARAFLDDAWWLLVSRRPTLEVDLAAGTVLEANVVRVIAAMVLRVLRNPDGYDSETIDDYTYRRNSLMASGALHVTTDELADLTPSAPGSTSRRHSVRLVVYGDA
jgi:hypothetical protein